MTLKNVLLVTETYRPEINGVATTLGKWVDGMLALGIRVTVIRPKQHSADKAIDSRTFDRESEKLVFGLPIPGYADLKFGLVSQKWMKHQLQRIKPCAIYIATEGPLGYAALKAAKQLKIGAVTGFHTNFQSYSKFYNFGFLEPLIMKYMRWFHNTSASTLVPTQQQKQMLEHKGFTNTEVVSRGIDGELFSPTKRNQQLRDQWGASENEPVFLYVGRIAAEKNLELLADTYESISEKYPKAKFVLVGDGPLKPSLAARYPALIFAGVKRGEKLAQHYASGDIFLFPSQTDTFGNVVTEAMASGCCICAFDDAAAKEHLDNRQSAFLADLGDDRQFIKNAIAAYEKTDLRKNLSMSSVVLAQRLNWQKLVQQFCKTLEKSQSTQYGKAHANRSNLRFKPESSSR
ncbi:MULTISPECIES: glycosyltransferase family 1 protein [unclassified Oleiphilus]|nr:MULTISPECIES: glycosyltransferase family 1 protein [unclassified Oleiphilus]KZY62430.1 hypothetical protein A3738_02765 [Oleiphilus sp. HI0066]KZY69786.1 hypothetical protein A3739_08185 [Oleiphilus sp. HI0067]